MSSELSDLMEKAKQQLDEEKPISEKKSANELREPLESEKELNPVQEQEKLSKEINEYGEEIQELKQEIKVISKSKEEEEMENFEKLIRENKNIKKEAENNLFLKKKEMEIMTRMDMKTVNKLLLNDDLSLISKDKEILETYKKLEEESKSPEKSVNFYSILPKRVALSKQETYKKPKRDFYKGINEKEVKALHEEMRQNKENLRKSKTIDDYEGLYHKYYKEYHNFLQRQPTAEAARQEIINNMAEAHEMMSALKTPISFDAIKLWGQNEPSLREKEEINKYIERKEFLIKNKWKLDIEQPFKRDITQEIDDYLQEKLARLADKYNNQNFLQ